MTRTLTTRPNLDHFRGQAKTLLAELRAGDANAAKTFIKHLPKARGLTASQARSAEFKLADAQSAVARRSGFPSWPALVKHVEQLRALEGEWTFESLEVDGATIPSAMIAQSKLMLDGDLFRMESPEGNYDGHFSIDTSVTPMQIDIDFIEGPEEGNSSYGIFKLDGDRLIMCIGVVGATRPAKFISKAATGHALEQLRRGSASRPAGVTGGVGKKQSHAKAKVDMPDGNPADFAVTSSPMLRRLQGTWSPVRMITNGEEMRADWLPFGSRTIEGNETKVIFGGQVMLDAKMRIDETARPIAVDYLNMKGRDKGKVSLGILEWVGDEICFLIANAGQPRPRDFSAGAAQTLSQWKRKGDA